MRNRDNKLFRMYVVGRTHKHFGGNINMKWIIAFIAYLFARFTSLSISWVIFDNLCEKRVQRLKKSGESSVKITLTKTNYMIKLLTFTSMFDIVLVLVVCLWLGGATPPTPSPSGRKQPRTAATAAAGSATENPASTAVPTISA